MAQKASTTTTVHTPNGQSEDLKEFVGACLNDTDLIRTRHQFTAYGTVLLIVASIIILVLETDSGIAATYGPLLKTFDAIIMVIFTLEYIARIWVASLAFKGMKGWRASLLYMRSFYGLMDLLAIIPFYVGLLFPFIHVGDLRILRLFRLLLLGRYFKSFPLLKTAAKQKAGEILITLQVIVVLTIILSVLMYEVEHEAQSKAFPDILSAILWSLSKFIDDIAGLGSAVPTTPTGKFVATVIGLLGIAQFVLPVAILASGFTHEIQEEKRRKDLEAKRERLTKAFREVRNRRLGQMVPRKYITMVQAKSRLDLREEDIISMAESHDGIRLRYKRVNRTDAYPSALIIEHFNRNRSYGTCISRPSSLVTIISPESYDQPSIGHFSLCLSKLLDCIYISNELFGSEESVDPDRAYSFSTNEGFIPHRDNSKRPEIIEFCKDIKDHVNRGTLAVVIRPGTSLVDDVPHSNGKGIVTDIAEINYNSLCSGNSQLLLGHLLEVKPKAADRNDIHCFIQLQTGAKTLSINVHPDLLEWIPLDQYYDIIRNLAVRIQELARKHNVRILDHGTYPDERHLHGNGVPMQNQIVA